MINSPNETNAKPKPVRTSSGEAMKKWLFEYLDDSSFDEGNKFSVKKDLEGSIIVSLDNEHILTIDSSYDSRFFRITITDHRNNDDEIETTFKSGDNVGVFLDTIPNIISRGYMSLWRKNYNEALQFAKKLRNIPEEKVKVRNIQEEKIKVRLALEEEREARLALEKEREARLALAKETRLALKEKREERLALEEGESTTRLELKELNEEIKCLFSDPNGKFCL